MRITEKRANEIKQELFADMIKALENFKGQSGSNGLARYLKATTRYRSFNAQFEKHFA